MAKVPDTETFSLQDVVNVVGPSSNDLVQCFADAYSDGFDPLYEGSKNNLLNFRNYEHVDYISASDWYLPSLTQLERMYDELHFYGLGDFTTLNFREYWSSDVTGYQDTYAYVLWFYDRTSSTEGKDSLNPVRAVRHFSTQGDQYDLRDTGPSGGLIFYKQLLSGTTWVYEEAMPYDQGSEEIWGTARDLCDNLVYPEFQFVTSITITGPSTTIETDGGTLQLSAEVLPNDADNKTVLWSIIYGSGEASISSSGLVTAISNGTVTARAIAQDGSGVYDDYAITISNQTVTMKFASSTTYIVNNSDYQEGYRAVLFSERESGDIMDISLNASGSVTGFGSREVFYRKNGGSWISLAVDGPVIIPGVDYNDTIEVGISASATGSGSVASQNIELAGLFFVQGTGTVSIESPNSFSVMASVI